MTTELARAYAMVYESMRRLHTRMKNPIFLLAFVSALGSGLVAGIFFAFSTFIMRALARLPPAQGIAAMQAINVDVLNRWFFAAFFGTALCCLVLAVSSFFRWHKPDAIYLFAGSLFYLVGTILVTILFNVPLNDGLAAVDPTNAAAGPIWANYLKTWTLWNHVRTAAAFAAAASFSVALSHAGSPTGIARSKASSSMTATMLADKAENGRVFSSSTLTPAISMQ
jgi:uncharacterized membrane protein